MVGHITILGCAWLGVRAEEWEKGKKKWKENECTSREEKWKEKYRRDHFSS